MIGNSTREQRGVHRAGEADGEQDQRSEARLHNHDIPVGTTEFGAVADQIKQSGADSMYTAWQRRGIALVTALKQAGVKPKPSCSLAATARGARPARLRRRVLRHRVQAVRAQRHEAAKGLDDFKKWMGTEAPSAPLSQITAVGWICANTFIEGDQGRRCQLPDSQGVHQQPAHEKGYTGRTASSTTRRRPSTSPRSTASRSSACTTCTSRTSSSCRSSTASRSVRSS